MDKQENAARAIQRLAVLSGYYIGRSGEGIEHATFREHYTFLTGRTEQEAEDVYKEARLQGISLGDLKQLIMMGYEHDGVMRLLHTKDAQVIIDVIIRYGLRPENKK